MESERYFLTETIYIYSQHGRPPHCSIVGRSGCTLMKINGSADGIWTRILRSKALDAEPDYTTAPLLLWRIYTLGMRQASGQEHLSRKVDALDYSMSNASTKVIQKVIMNNPNKTVSNIIYFTSINFFISFTAFHIFLASLLAILNCVPLNLLIIYLRAIIFFLLSFVLELVFHRFCEKLIPYQYIIKSQTNLNYCDYSFMRLPFAQECAFGWPWVGPTLRMPF